MLKTDARLWKRSGFLLCLLALLAFSALPAFAQISPESKEQQRKEQKRFLKEAAKTESVYKDTHLNTDTYTFKKGEAGRINAKNNRAAYLFDENGKPIKKKKLFEKKRRQPKKKRID
ncbi:hypothetical protein [Pontibacter liquoris]|uniref:hypothetical protein n=1 Tax=Pontibacter liquoris TaxID=2905677 RepID=UPI001FA7D96B|nr:hypothetical protein [Pontibacter liquoris]